MKGIAVLILCIFSVVIPIQSQEIIYVYNYDSFGDMYPQGEIGLNEFHVDKYADIDTIFATEYKGTHIGGAFLVQGWTSIKTDAFEGYITDITTTFYCGGTYPEEPDSLWIDVYYNDVDHDRNSLCTEKGWHYNYTWIPASGAKYQGFKIRTAAVIATINKAYGFDELRITTTTDQPPQLTNVVA